MQQLLPTMLAAAAALLFFMCQGSQALPVCGKLLYLEVWEGQ